MKRSTVQILAYVLLIVTVILAITSITLASVDFKYTNLNWTNDGFRALGATELAAILFLWVMIIIGFIAICLDKTPCLVILLILVLMSFLFSFAAAIFSFLGTRTRYWNAYLGCNSKFRGFLQAWNSVDLYLQSVDDLFCSPKCPCYFNRTTSLKFLSNQKAAPYYNQWYTKNLTLYPRRFQDCNDTEVAEAYNNYLNTNAYNNHTFNQKRFHKYFAKIEAWFDCTGFCSTTYNSTMTGTTNKMVKYLFSDVTLGVPKHIGCLEPMLDWLWKTMNAFGSCCLFLFVIDALLFVMIILLLCLKRDDEEEVNSEGEKQESEENKMILSEQQKPLQSEQPIVIPTSEREIPKEAFVEKRDDLPYILENHPSYECPNSMLNEDFNEMELLPSCLNK